MLCVCVCAGACANQGLCARYGIIPPNQNQSEFNIETKMSLSLEAGDKISVWGGENV